MRAIVIKDTEVDVGEELAVTEEAHRHLKVTRCIAGETILLLLGKGDVAQAEILKSNKTETTLKIRSTEHWSRLSHIEICIGLVKKDAMEEIAKLVTELGVEKVVPLLTKYSQRPSNQFKRWDRIVEQAQEQSNNAYTPILAEPVEIRDFLFSQKDLGLNNYLFSSKPDDFHAQAATSEIIKKRLFIGPEGGFSSDEEDLIVHSVGAQKIHLCTPILRAPTAVSVGVGHVLSC